MNETILSFMSCKEQWQSSNRVSMRARQLLQRDKELLDGLTK